MILNQSLILWVLNNGWSDTMEAQKGWVFFVYKADVAA